MIVFIFFRRMKMDWRDVGIRASCQIKRKRKRKRKRKEGVDQKEEEKNPPFSSILEIMLSFLLLISFSKDTQG
jgi:hypothetical protein